MKKLFKILGFAILTIIGLLILAVLFILIRYPQAEAAADIRIEPTAERVSRGKYLIENVIYCMNCHSERDWELYTGPIVPGTEGKGAFLDDPVLPVYSANITPFNLGDWTDGEIMRAITAGINKEGKALHPMMPYDSYANISEQDVQAIVAYLRNLAPIEFVVPEPDLSILAFFLTNLVGRLLPEPYEPKPHPNESDMAAYGKYLVEIAECGVCHGPDYAGGPSFQGPPGQRIRAKNLTPTETGIGTWTRENFIGVFKSFTSPEIRQLPVPEGEENTGMPWLGYSGMSERDLTAIYEYLRTVEPIETNEEGMPSDSEKN